MPIYIPPNGLAGFAQQTPAVRAMSSSSKVRSVRVNTGKLPRRRRVKGVKASKPNSSVYRKRRKKKGAGAAKLVKGSAAAKRHMAKLRAMRK